MSHHRRVIWLTSPPRWVVGAACTILGATLLIAPHHLLGAAAGSHGRLDLPGLTLVLAGLQLLLVETFRPGRLPLLVVDDNPINRKVTARIAERLGFDVDTAKDGHAAVDAAARKRYAAILMDCQMPNLDGYEATLAIRAVEPPGQRVPIIALTANAFGGVRDECLAAGMDDYLAKPTTVATVSAMLERWVRPADGQHKAGPAQFAEEQPVRRVG